MRSSETKTFGQSVSAGGSYHRAFTGSDGMTMSSCAAYPKAVKTLSRYASPEWPPESTNERSAMWSLCTRAPSPSRWAIARDAVGVRTR